MAKLEPRKMMELAVEVMKQSISERRQDEKACPKVGAVLWSPDGNVVTATRGELRDGDHAEYTLLERKNFDRRLDQSILFTTLEPCAPGARKHPKLGCAERIALTRMKEVWVGIEDPDPAVDRKGIRYLQDRGIKVHMFDRDLQEVIRVENGDFIEQALGRAAADKVGKQSKTVLLSPLANRFENADLSDFSKEALEQYRDTAKIVEAVGSLAFIRRFVQQGLLVRDGRLFPTGFGLLLFGKKPRTMLPQAGLLGTIHFDNGTEETRDFDGPQALVPEQALQWLRDKLPAPIDRSEARRRNVNDAIFGLVRESLVNALVHRDYSIEGAKCQLIVSSDAISVMSPGKPVEPVTMEQLQTFSAPMLSRNPVVHYVFAQMELAEERGLGLKSMRLAAQKAGLPLPSYSWVDPYLVLKIYRNAAAVMSGLSSGILEQLNNSERAGLEWLSLKESGTASEYAIAFRVPRRTALNHLKHFTDLGLVVKLGSGPSTKYEIVKQ